MGALPNSQQQNRQKTVLFVNNHDTWRGAFWDSGSNNSTAHDDRSGDFRQIEGTELAPTIDPDNPRADVAYAAAFAVDGSVVVYYEDLFRNFGPDRKNADPQTYPTRSYVENLVRCHQRLNFKDGAYKVRFQGSPDLLVIERSRRALIGLNDHGSETLRARVQTDFGPGARLRDYSGAGGPDLTTDGSGQVEVAVPPMSYRVWGPASPGSAHTPRPRRTTQQFELADDLGDARPDTPGYGGRLVPGTFRAAGAVYVARNSTVRVQLFTDGRQGVELRVSSPDTAGKKSRTQGTRTAQGLATAQAPLRLEFQAGREGYYLLDARLQQSGAPPTGGRLVVEYAAPASSTKF
jgi:alpha-amylase